MAARNRRQVPQGGEDDDDNWMDTYADAITLLMAFFVVLYSMSEIVEEKYTAFSQAFSEAVGGHQQIKTKGESEGDGKGNAFDANLKELAQQLAPLVDSGAVEVNKTPKGITLEFNSKKLYRSGGADILPKSKPMLNKVARRINKFGKGTKLNITIEGHTDDTPIRTRRFPSNWELSTARATNIVKYLVGRNVNPQFLSAAGYADVRPKVPNFDSRGNPLPRNRAKNRRVVIKVERY